MFSPYPFCDALDVFSVSKKDEFYRHDIHVSHNVPLLSASLAKNNPVLGPNHEGRKHQPRPKSKLTTLYLYAKSSPSHKSQDDRDGFNHGLKSNGLIPSDQIFHADFKQESTCLS